MRAHALLVVALVVGLVDAALARKPLFSRGGPSTTYAVVGFHEDGTRALLQEKQVAVARGAQTVATSFLVVDGAGLVFDVLISDVARVHGSVVEGIDNATCRDRMKALEQALTGFRSVKARLGNCSRPTRADVVIEPMKTTPAALAISEALAVLQRELGVLDGLFFVSDDGPLVVVVQADREDIFGRSAIVKTFLREDPRLNDRWPAP